MRKLKLYGVYNQPKVAQLGCKRAHTSTLPLPWLPSVAPKDTLYAFIQQQTQAILTDFFFRPLNFLSSYFSTHQCSTLFCLHHTQHSTMYKQTTNISLIMMIKKYD